jgi:hypothetical protein
VLVLPMFVSRKLSDAVVGVRSFCHDAASTLTVQ